MIDATVHEKIHTLIDRRCSAYATAVTRTTRRERRKKAVGTLVSHLKGDHGLRFHSLGLTVEDLVAMHEKAHES